MEPDLEKDEEEVAPLRERLLWLKETDKQSLSSASCVLFRSSPGQSVKHISDSSNPALISEEKIQSSSLSSPKANTKDKDDSMTSLFESSGGEDSQTDVENHKERDTYEACSVSPVFHSSCHPSLIHTFSPVSLEKVTRNFGVGKAKETFEKETVKKPKNSDPDQLCPSQVQIQNSNLNVDAPGISIVGKDNNTGKSPLKNFTNRNERKKDKEEVPMIKRSKREVENGSKEALSSLKLKYRGHSSTPVDDDGSLVSENDENPKRKRQGVEFEFRGLSQGEEENHQSWSRKGKLVVSKNGAAKSKVKGIGRRTLVSSVSGIGVDSCGVKSSSGLEIKTDGKEKCHQKDCENSESPIFDRRSHHKDCEKSESPVFDRHNSIQPESRKRKKVMPRSFNWEDDIPPICGETAETKHCKKHRSHSVKDGERHHSSTNGFYSTSPKHTHRKERFPQESSTAGHRSENHGSRYDDIHHLDHRIRSTTFDPRFYPEVHRSGRTNNHYVPDQLKRKTIHQSSRGQDRSSTLKESDPKTSPRYNKYLLRHQRRRFAAEDVVEREASSGIAHEAHREKNEHSKDISQGSRQNLHTSNRSRSNRDLPSNDKTSRRQTNQRKHGDLSRDRAHRPESPSSSRSQSRNVSQSDPTTSPVDTVNASSTPLDLSQTERSQGSRNRTKRRKTHSDVRAAVISDDEDADIILEGTSPGVSQSSGRGRGERRQVDHVSITEIIDDDEDDPVIILGDNEENRGTPSGAHRVSVHDLSDGVEVTPRTAAAIQQLEADEALARRLQLEFDREEATLAPPPQQHHEYNAPPGFSHHRLLDEMVRSLTSEFSPESHPGGISFQFTSQVMPWLSPQHPPRPRRRVPRRNNRRGHMGHDHPTYEEGNPDDYERLLELAEHLGPAVPQGLPVEVLTRLPTFKFQEVEGGGQLKEEDRSCAICMSEYEASEELRRLPCFHAYHTRCIDKWFEQNSACPICRVRVQLD